MWNNSAKKNWIWLDPWFTLRAESALAFFHYHMLEAWEKPVGSFTLGPWNVTIFVTT